MMEGLIPCFTTWQSYVVDYFPLTKPVIKISGLSKSINPPGFLSPRLLKSSQQKDVAFYVSGYIPNIWSWIYIIGRETKIPIKHSAAVKHFTLPLVFPTMNYPVEFVTILTWYLRFCTSSLSWPSNHGATQQCSMPCLHGTLLTLSSESNSTFSFPVSTTQAEQMERDIPWSTGALSLVV